MRTVILTFIVSAGLLAAAPIDADTRADRGESSTAPNASSARTLPPIGVSVLVAPQIPSATVSRLLAETAEIWRPNGVTFDWLFPSPAGAYGETPDPGRYRASTLTVTIGNERGSARRISELPLGWIRFDGASEPEPLIHLSYANASALLEESTGIVGNLHGMPQLEREMYMSRVMGRALAHELGHYLLASKSHTVRGLMQTSRSASELFGRDRVHFELDSSQRRAALSRLSDTMVLTRR